MSELQFNYKSEFKMQKIKYIADQKKQKFDQKTS